ncbi:MAG: DUF6263 family protein [Flavobacteriales bacterium]
MYRIALLSAAFLMTLVSCGGEKEPAEKEKPTGEKVLLRFKPVKGTNYHVVYTSEMNFPSVGDKTVSNLEVKLNVDSVNDKRTWCSAMFSHFDIQNTSVGVTSSFDSDKDTAGGDPRIMAMFAPIISIMNKKTSMVVDDQLQIIKQPNFDSLVPKEFQMGMSSLGLDKSFEEFFVVWPDEEIMVGSTWNRDMDIMEELQLKIKAVYKVTKIDKEYVYLDLLADIDSKEERGGVKITVKGKIKGLSRVRRSDGWMYESETSLDLTVKSPGTEERMSNRIKVTTK